MRYAAVLAVVVLILAVSGAAKAITVEGDPYEVDSWGQRWQEAVSETDCVQNKPPNTVAHFDTIQFDLVDLPTDKYADVFEQTASLAFSRSGWTAAFYNGGRDLVITGPAVTSGNLQWNLTYTTTDMVWNASKGKRVYPSDYKSDPLEFHFQAYYQGQLRQNQDCYWTGTQWQYGAGTWQAQRVIPEPVTMAGLGLGLCGLVGYIRRRRAS
jgi:hypothetical protein